MLRRVKDHLSARAADSSEAVVATAIGYLSATNSTYGADPTQAGETTVGPGNADVWLVPGSTGACLVDVEGPQGAGSTCNTASAVEAGELWTLDTVPYGTAGVMTHVLIGAAPDGNSSVTVSWTGGASTTIPVEDNIYSVPVGSHTGWKSVTLKNASGGASVVPGMSSLP